MQMDLRLLDRRKVIKPSENAVGAIQGAARFRQHDVVQRIVRFNKQCRGAGGDDAARNILNDPRTSGAGNAGRPQPWQVRHVDLADANRDGRCDPVHSMRDLATNQDNFGRGVDGAGYVEARLANRNRGRRSGQGDLATPQRHAAFADLDAAFTQDGC